jgi:hypothetical protein
LYLSQNQFVDHQKFRRDRLDWGLLGEMFSASWRVRSPWWWQHCQDANGIPFSRRIPTTERNVNQQDGVLSAANIKKEGDCVLFLRLWYSVHQWVFCGLPYKLKLMK